MPAENKTSKMTTLNKEEISAIYKAADLMVNADGKVMPEEVTTVEMAMRKIGVTSQAELETIKKIASTLSEDECYGTLAFLDFNLKRFTSAMLGTISSSDGDIDDKELKLWRNICDKCDLPVMSNRQAIDIYLTY